MSIERDDSREISFVCDSCGVSEDTYTADFLEAVEHIKEAGWQVRKIGEDWVHCCSRDCLRQM